MGMTVQFDPGVLEASIRNIADRASKDAAKVMRKAAIRIRDLARDYAPRKTGTLEKAIDYGTIKDPGTRRNVYVIYIDLDMDSASGKKQVGDYAKIMEEQLEPYGRGKYNLGVGSAMKAILEGKKVGGKFLERAVREGTDRLVGDVTLAVSAALGSRLVNVNYGSDE